MALVLIGDVHGKKEGYFRVLDFMEDYCSLQIGDMDFYPAIMIIMISYMIVLTVLVITGLQS